MLMRNLSAPGRHVADGSQYSRLTADRRLRRDPPRGGNWRQTAPLAIPMAVWVVTVVPGVTVVAVMVVAAVIIAFPPATRLGFVRDEDASEQKCYECGPTMIFIGDTSPLELIWAERHRDVSARCLLNSAQA